MARSTRFTLMRLTHFCTFGIQSENHEKRFWQAPSGRKTQLRRRNQQTAAMQRGLGEVEKTAPNSKIQINFVKTFSQFCSFTFKINCKHAKMSDDEISNLANFLNSERFFFISIRPRCIAAVCWFLLRGSVFRPDVACKKRFSWFSDWIPKVQTCVNLVDLVKSFQTST